MIWLLAACAGPLPDAPPAPTFAEVEVYAPAAVTGGDGWTIRAASATVEANAATTTAITAASDAAPPVDIQAERSQWDLKARSVRFDGAVKVTRGPVVLTCDALDVTYADASSVDRIRAEGHVVVTRGERRARAEHAELVARTGVITLTGDPSLEEGPNRLVGERITLLLDDEQVTCDGGAAPCRLVIAGSALPGAAR